ncbi:MAG: succinate dehydrogenase, cytochrome b556 subunit [Gammaproteobacteria bacterium]|nr:succinate dehydrogenase, cytochrome b556 subunit [Gammaproteobacteria bacterium]
MHPPQHPRTRALWLAFLLHRVSGILLALFLPLHFYLLGLALRDAEALDGYLALAAHPFLKIAEFGLVFLLAAHLCGGLRILAFEFLPWRNWQKGAAAAALALAFAFACGFLLRAF